MRIILCLLAAVVAAVVAPGGAAASAETRAAYAERVEPICKANAPAIERLLDGTREMANNGRPVTAGRRFIRASRVFADTVRGVSAVHRPAPEAARLGKWIERLDTVKEKMRLLGVALKQGSRLMALNRLSQLRDSGNSANQAVAGFHLHHCRIYASRFN
jgi:hypothetical protein